MRPLLLSLILALGSFAPVVAQDSIALGRELRVRTRGSSRRLDGRFGGVRSDTLLIVRPMDTVAVPMTSVRRVEANFRGGLRHEAAFQRAVIGFGAGVLQAALIGTEERSDYGGAQAAIVVVTHTAVGYLAGGSGTNGRRGALIGMAVGAPVGIALATADYTPCPPNGILCFEESFFVIVGLMAGAAVGGVLGMMAGAMIPGDHWERVSKDRLRLTFAPGDGGVSFGAAIRF